MQYRTFGRSGVTTSSLGFGAMRLPMRDKEHVNRELAIPLLLRAYELGINYFDTGKFYCGGDSESTLGEALKLMDRSRIHVSTKYAKEHATADDLLRKFETSLRNLATDYVDFYHLWGISWQAYTEELAIPGGPVEGLLKLKDQGLVKHLAFSFHSKPSEIPKLVDTGLFETMLCQYNLLDRSNAEGIAYAASKGLGVAVMGPLGGGRLGGPSRAVAKLMPVDRRVSSPELALRFVFSNPLVTMALSGMASIEQLEANVATASRNDPLSDDELDNIALSVRENQRLMDLYCTACKYCEPCPEGVNISEIFSTMNHYQVWDLKEYAKARYAEIGVNPWIPGKRADACIECGACEDKCPQSIAIIDQLKECQKLLGS